MMFDAVPWEHAMWWCIHNDLWMSEPDVRRPTQLAVDGLFGKFVIPMSEHMSFCGFVQQSSHFAGNSSCYCSKIGAC